MKYNATILIVDDDRQFVKILKDWFESRGFKTFVSYNGKEALDLFKKEKFDIVLLDALIPKLDGFKTCEAMRKVQDKKNTPIIMMSAIYKAKREIDRAKSDAGATDYITKPLNLLDLYNKVTEILRKKT